MCRKILVIGCPGSGKSTFARKLSEKTGLPLHHLDMLFWNADKTTVSGEEFTSRLDAVLRQKAWIIDGNYASTLEKRMAKCDRVYFLDYPPETCLDGIHARLNQPRADMPWIETEFDPDFMDFVCSFPEEVLPGMLEILQSFPDKEIIVFHSRAEAAEYLETENALL